jgi:hypothetical protein
MTAETIKNTDPHGLRIEVTNLPAHATHHTVELIRYILFHLRFGISIGAEISLKESADTTEVELLLRRHLMKQQ